MEESVTTLIDTSSWIEALRKSGNPDVRERVRRLMINGEAAWCDMVALELWNGARGEYEKKQLTKLEAEMLLLPIKDDVWHLSRRLARVCRERGKTVPVADVLIAACALHHKANIEHCDDHFAIILEAYREYSQK